METLNELFREYLNPSSTASNTTELLGEFLERPEVPQLLLRHILDNPDSTVKALAATLLKRRVHIVWKSLPADFQRNAQNELLRTFLEEVIPSAESALTQLIAAIADLCFEEWKVDIFGFIRQCAASPHLLNRRKMYKLLTALHEICSDEMQPYLSEIFSVLHNDLSNRDNELPLVALKYIQIILPFCKDPPDVELLRDILKPIVNSLQASVNSEDDKMALHGMEILHEMIERADIIKTDDIPDLVRFMLSVAQRTDLSVSLRDQGLHFQHWVAKNKPKGENDKKNEIILKDVHGVDSSSVLVLIKGTLLDEILNVIVAMAAEEEGEVDEDELTAHMSAIQMMDSLAINLPGKRVFSATIDKLQPFTVSINPNEKKAALILLGVMSEGCRSIMKNQLNNFLPFVYKSFEDASPKIKGAAATCLGQFADYLQPEIWKYHAQIMHHLMKLVSSEDIKVQEKGCYALKSFCDGMERGEVNPYLDNLMTVLLTTLTHTTSMTIRESCLGAIAAVAQAAKAMFMKYAVNLMGILQNLLEIKSDEEKLISVQTQAISVISNVASALPVEMFASYRPIFMKLISEKMETSHHHIREEGFLFFKAIAETMGETFGEFVDAVMIYIFYSLLAMENPEELEDSPKVGKEENKEESDFGGVEVNEGYVDEVAAAVVCLRQLWKSCPKMCVQYYVKTELVIKILSFHFHSEACEQCSSLIHDVLLGIHNAHPPPHSPTQLNGKYPWISGIPVKSPLHVHTKNLWEKTLWPFLFGLMKDNIEKSVITTTCNELADLCEELGPDILESHIQEIMGVIDSLLKQTHACQQAADIDQ
ncbi:HEAT repeat-containing protein, partial [Cardiosporidium cionae]